MNTQADFAATLVDEWVIAGVRDAVVSPGSRSSPLAVALLADPAVRVHVRLDERSAAFFAIGCSLGTGRPTVLVTTSGTAAAEVHAAVIEADLGGVPLIVCTADRPPELHRVGAPQTIDQQGLFGGAVRLYLEPGVPDEATRGTWRSMASRLVAESVAGPRGPGPVHCNLAFRDPLTGERGEPAPKRRSGARSPWHERTGGVGASRAAVAALLGAVAGVERGVIIAGAGAGGARPEDEDGATTGGSSPDAAPVLALARALGWPVLTDPRAWPREPYPEVVAACDGLVRSSAALSVLLPDVVLHLGAPHASKVLASWCVTTSAAGAEHVVVDPYGRFQDPDRTASKLIAADPAELALAAVERLDASAGTVTDRTWLSSWQRAEQAAQEAIDEVLAPHVEVTEPGVARDLFALLPPGATLVASSSMPIRDLEWFARARPGAPAVLANRGANGIDGITSTVLGVASACDGAGGPVVGLLGDLAFLHDVSGLVWGAAEERPDATLVVVDNAGGGIFNFLPYAASLDEASFERGFATPQACDLGHVALGFGCGVLVVDKIADLGTALDTAIAEGGLQVVLVRTERRANVALHEELHAAVASAVDLSLAVG
jgi:2-succinyl-5-enolpyruvyl-6-hydroxy-3-cyclohexene-1-carboxylate synthase